MIPLEIARYFGGVRERNNEKGDPLQESPFSQNHL
jgi:hypothetical protein